MPHRFPKHLEKLKDHGQFNVSWLTFNSSKNSSLCLNWWMKSCLNGVMLVLMKINMAIKNIWISFQLGLIMYTLSKISHAGLRRGTMRITCLIIKLFYFIINHA